MAIETLIGIEGEFHQEADVIPGRRKSQMREQSLAELPETAGCVALMVGMRYPNQSHLERGVFKAP